MLRNRHVRCGFWGLIALASCCSLLIASDWRQFRGTNTSSVSDDSKCPLTWSAAGDNVAWKGDLPGRGLSGPIVVGNRVFVTASSGFRDDRLHVLCFDDKTGEQLWERQFWATGSTMCHAKMCMATPTPASDGERIFAFYSSNDVICLDLDGNLQWYRGLNHDYPNACNSLGMSSSPVVAGGVLVLQVESDSESFALALDVLDGLERWKVDRPKLANWTSPSVLRGKNVESDVVLLQSGKGLTAYNAATGNQLWNFDKGASTIPSAVVGGETVYIPSNGLTAVRIPAEKSVPEIVWQENRLSPETPSPLFYDDRLFTIKSPGILVCADAQTGKTLWQLRLKGPFCGTPVAAGGFLYIFNEEGHTDVVKTDGSKGEVVGTNELGETILCTPAIANGAIYVRSHGHLWKLAEK